jgi:hypothetical protein
MHNNQQVVIKTVQGCVKKMAHVNYINALAAREIDARGKVARLDMPIGLSSIVRPHRKGAAKRNIEVTQSWKGGEIKLKGIALSDHDLGVLLALLVIAAQSNPEPVLGSFVEGILNPKYIELEEVKSGITNVASEQQVVTVITSYAEICRILGVKECGDVNNAIFQSLEDLAGVVLSAKAGVRRAFTNLIYNGTSNNKSLSVTLCYRLTIGLLSIGSDSYAPIDMKIFVALPKGVPRIIYTWILAWFSGAHGKRRIGINRLIGHVWGEDNLHKNASTITKQQARQRNTDRTFKIKKALASISTVDPHLIIQFDTRSLVTINRIR